MTTEAFQKIVNNIPHLPGIYKYFDANNNLLYVGKAKNLRKRVSSYFTKNLTNYKTQKLVESIENIEFTIVDTEQDAFLLENALIKKFKPKYNILAKDDKTYPYIVIKNEPFARVYFTRKKIRNTGKVEDKRGVILHGPYKRYVGEQLVEEGIFYKGTKNGRWTTYDGKDMLTDKRKYYQGWPKDSKVRYYDEKQTKLKEVIPIVYGKKEGTYYYFHENGEVAVKGEYKEDVKVGKWTEYYPFMSRRKKEIQYPAGPYDTSYLPFISKEWDKNNKLVYEAKL